MTNEDIDCLSILILNLPRRRCEPGVPSIYVLFMQMHSGYKLYVYMFNRVNVEPCVYVHMQNNVINMLLNIYLQGSR